MSKREGAIKDLKESLKADSERIIKIVRLEAELKAKNEALNRAMGRITALSLKDGRVTMANLYEQLKELQTENEKMADMLIAGSFLGRGTQLIGDMRYQELLKAEAENKDLKEARKKPEPTEFTKIRRSKRDAEIEEANRFYDENIALLRKNDIEERYRWDMKACEIIDSLTAENEAFKREKTIWIMTHNVNVEKIQQLTAKLKVKENHKKSNRCNCGYC